MDSVALGVGLRAHESSLSLKVPQAVTGLPAMFPTKAHQSGSLLWSSGKDAWLPSW